MDYPNIPLLVCSVFVVAVLYSCVGHAGASGYIAVMALMGLSSDVIKPTALVLNIVVALITSIQFYRAGHFSWSLFWPFAITSVPLAFVGGSLGLPLHVFEFLIGATLLFSSVRFLFEPTSDTKTVVGPNMGTSLLVGAVIGLLSGLTGVGGGIFLTPVLLLLGWAKTQQAAAISAPFILVNSIAGLAGHLSSVQHIPAGIPFLILAVVCGGFIGSHLGSRRLRVVQIRRVLAVVLIIAGIKLLST
jgi:uncharacterized membrane protein YfcA